MIYSHYSEYMARGMSANRPLPDPGEYAWLQGHLSSNEQPFVFGFPRRWQITTSLIFIGRTPF